MDYFKLIAEMQSKFKKNPREGIKKMIEDEKQLTKNIGNLSLDPGNLLILKKFHKEYSNIIGKLMEANILDVGKLIDYQDSVSIIQRLNEWTSSVEAYKSEVNETTALRLSRAYASSTEVMWKKLKRLISLAGLNPDNKYMNIPTLLRKLKKLEGDYCINLSNIKNYVNSELRNFVDHESSVFIPPNIISFLDTSGNQSREVKRLSTDEVYNLLVSSTIMSKAFFIVDNSAIVSKIEPLLKLSNKELDDYIKTGVLTSAMKKKMYG